MGRLTRKDKALLETLDRAVAFDRAADNARTASPSAFPSEITCTKRVFENGTFEHLFHHAELGDIGRIRVEQRGGITHTTSLVAGTTEDPLHDRRDAVFRQVVDAFARAGNQRVVQGKHMPCERCGAIAASIIFIDGGEAHDFEECARQMFLDYSRRLTPTWIIGPQAGDGPEPERAADIMQVWPQRGPKRRLTPAEFNPLCGRFIDDHCRPAAPPAGLPKKRRR